MAEDHEYAKDYGNNVTEVWDVCMKKGTIIEIDREAGTASVEIDGIGRKDNVPIFYHCQGSNDTEHGHTAFKEEDAVLVLAENSRAGWRESYSVVGFQGGLKYCSLDIIFVLLEIQTSYSAYNKKYCLLYDPAKNEPVDMLGEYLFPYKYDDRETGWSDDSFMTWIETEDISMPLWSAVSCSETMPPPRYGLLWWDYMFSQSNKSETGDITCQGITGTNNYVKIIGSGSIAETFDYPAYEAVHLQSLTGEGSHTIFSTVDSSGSGTVTISDGPQVECPEGTGIEQSSHSADETYQFTDKITYQGIFGKFTEIDVQAEASGSYEYAGGADGRDYLHAACKLSASTTASPLWSYDDYRTWAAAKSDRTIVHLDLVFFTDAESATIHMAEGQGIAAYMGTTTDKSPVSVGRNYDFENYILSQIRNLYGNPEPIEYSMRPGIILRVGIIKQEV
jgi:hypothetical protein